MVRAGLWWALLAVVAALIASFAAQSALADVPCGAGVTCYDSDCPVGQQAYCDVECHWTQHPPRDDGDYVCTNDCACRTSACSNIGGGCSAGGDCCTELICASDHTCGTSGIPTAAITAPSGSGPFDSSVSVSMRFEDSTLSGLDTCQFRTRLNGVTKHDFESSSVACSGLNTKSASYAFSSSSVGCGAGGSCEVCVRASNNEGELSGNYASGGTCQTFTIGSVGSTIYRGNDAGLNWASRSADGTSSATCTAAQCATENSCFAIGAQITGGAYANWVCGGSGTSPSLYRCGADASYDQHGKILATGGGSWCCATTDAFTTNLAQCPTNNCGNGVIDADEQCDGALLGGATCQSLGFSGGSLTCSATCQYNTAACTTLGPSRIYQGASAGASWSTRVEDLPANGVATCDTTTSCADHSGNCYGLNTIMSYAIGSYTWGCGDVGLGPAAYQCRKDDPALRGHTLNSAGVTFCCDNNGLWTADLTDCTSCSSAGNTCGAGGCCSGLYCIDGTCQASSGDQCSTREDCNTGNPCVGYNCQGAPGSKRCVRWGVTCNDGVACTTDSCDPLSGCKYLPMDSGSSCGTNEVCDGTVCIDCDVDKDTYRAPHSLYCPAPANDCRDVSVLPPHPPFSTTIGGDNRSIRPGAAELCTSGWDENCDGEADYDGYTGGLVNDSAHLGSGVFHGDASCPVGIRIANGIAISPSSISGAACAGGNFTINCTANVGNVRSIAVSGPSACSWFAWSATTAQFTCAQPPGDGANVYTCFVDTTRSHALSDATYAPSASASLTLSCRLTVLGTVRDAVTHGGVPGATVEYSGGIATSQSDGTYTLGDTVTSGTYNFTAQKAGYQTARRIGIAVSADPTTVDFDLSPDQCTPQCTFGGVCDYTCVGHNGCAINVPASNLTAFESICQGATDGSQRVFNSTHVANCCLGPIQPRYITATPLTITSCARQLIPHQVTVNYNGKPHLLTVMTYRKC